MFLILTCTVHSTTIPRNFGFVMGIGSFSPALRSYEEFNVFQRTGASVTWTMALLDTHKYTFATKAALSSLSTTRAGNVPL
jgi:hypothetical protein